MSGPGATARGPSAGERRWDLALLLLAILVAASVFGMRPLISYKALAMGAGTLEIGLIAAAFALFAVVASVPVGRLVDARGERRAVVIGALIVAGGCGVAWSADSKVQLGMAQAALGLGQLMVVVGSHAVLAYRGDPAGRDQRIGIYTTAVSLGHAVGPGLAGILEDPVVMPGGQDLFGAVAVTAALVAAALATLLPRGAGRMLAGRGGAMAAKASIRDTLRVPAMRQALVGSIAALAAIDLLIAYLPVLGTERGWQPALVGVMLGALGLSQMVSRLFIGRLIVRLGPAGLLRWSLVLPAVLIPAITLADLPVALVGTMVGIGLALGLSQPMTLSLVARAALPGAQGLAMSLRLAGNRLGQLTIPIALGATMGQLGAGGILIASGGILGIAWAYLGLPVRAGPAAGSPSPEAAAAAATDRSR